MRSLILASSASLTALNELGMRDRQNATAVQPFPHFLHRCMKKPNMKSLESGLALDFVGTHQLSLKLRAFWERFSYGL